MSFIPEVRNLSTFVVTFLHRHQDGGLVFERALLELKRLSRASADAGEPCAEALGVRALGHELQGGIEILVEVRLDALRGRREEVNLRHGGRCGWPQARRKR